MDDINCYMLKEVLGFLRNSEGSLRLAALVAGFDEQLDYTLRDS
jgi:hypothetical protein